MARSRWFTVLFALVCAAGGASRQASALEREFVLRWLPSSGTVGGYRAYLDSAGSATEVLELGAVAPDADGIARAAVQLDASLGYAISMTAYNDAGESGRSNSISVAASSCDPAACNDGDPCTADDCQDLRCIHTRLPDGSVCGSGSICVAGACVVPDCLRNSDCDDANACNGSESCAEFGCVAGAPLACAEPGPCQQGGCSASSGCWLSDLPDGTSCNDGDPDTTGDQCRAGHCSGTLFTGCRSDAECDDGNVCNGFEACASDGSCRPGTALVCGGSTQCADASCSPEGGCVMSPRPNGTACDDGDALTSGDQCYWGLCSGTYSGCRSDAECDDGDLCNGQETCNLSGACESGSPLVCGGSTGCADAYCDPRGGCFLSPRRDGTRCDDGVDSTDGDQCVAGVCVGVAVEGLSVSSVTPDALGGGRSYRVSLFGTGFADGMQVSFASPSSGIPPRISSTRILGSDRAELRVLIDRGAASGTWDVVVTRADGRTATLPGALRTEP